jgi:uncharacterized membrane protein YidH (DUF202 family)
MPKSLKLLVGALTAVPVILSGYLVVRFVSVFFGVLESGGAVSADSLSKTFYELVGVQFVTAGVLIVLLGFYLWHLLVRQARRKESHHVAIWAIAFFVVPFVAMPVYWFTNIWPDGDVEPARAQRT